MHVQSQISDSYKTFWFLYYTSDFIKIFSWLLFFILNVFFRIWLYVVAFDFFPQHSELQNVGTGKEAGDGNNAAFIL